MSKTQKQATLSSFITFPLAGAALSGIADFALSRKLKQKYDKDNLGKRSPEEKTDSVENARRLLRSLILGGGIGLGAATAINGANTVINNLFKTSSAKGTLLKRLVKKAEEKPYNFFDDPKSNYLLSGGGSLLGGMLLYHLLNDKKKRSLGGYLSSGLAGLGIGLGSAGLFNKSQYGTFDGSAPVDTPKSSPESQPVNNNEQPSNSARAVLRNTDQGNTFVNNYKNLGLGDIRALNIREDKPSVKGHKNEHMISPPFIPTSPPAGNNNPSVASTNNNPFIDYLTGNWGLSALEGLGASGLLGLGAAGSGRRIPVDSSVTQWATNELKRRNGRSFEQRHPWVSLGLSVTPVSPIPGISAGNAIGTRLFQNSVFGGLPNEILNQISNATTTAGAEVPTEFAGKQLSKDLRDRLVTAEHNLRVLKNVADSTEFRDNKNLQRYVTRARNHLYNLYNGLPFGYLPETRVTELLTPLNETRAQQGFQPLTQAELGNYVFRGPDSLNTVATAYDLLNNYTSGNKAELFNNSIYLKDLNAARDVLPPEGRVLLEQLNTIYNDWSPKNLTERFGQNRVDSAQLQQAIDAFHTAPNAQDRLQAFNEIQQLVNNATLNLANSEFKGKVKNPIATVAGATGQILNPLANDANTAQRELLAVQEYARTHNDNSPATKALIEQLQQRVTKTQKAYNDAVALTKGKTYGQFNNQFNNSPFRDVVIPEDPAVRWAFEQAIEEYSKNPSLLFEAGNGTPLSVLERNIQYLPENFKETLAQHRLIADRLANLPQNNSYSEVINNALTQLRSNPNDPTAYNNLVKAVTDLNNKFANTEGKTFGELGFNELKDYKYTTDPEVLKQLRQVDANIQSRPATGKAGVPINFTPEEAELYESVLDYFPDDTTGNTISKQGVQQRLSIDHIAKELSLFNDALPNGLPTKYATELQGILKELYSPTTPETFQEAYRKLHHLYADVAGEMAPGRSSMAVNSEFRQILQADRRNPTPAYSQEDRALVERVDALANRLGVYEDTAFADQTVVDELRKQYRDALTELYKRFPQARPKRLLGMIGDMLMPGVGTYTADGSEPTGRKRPGSRLLRGLIPDVNFGTPGSPIVTSTGAGQSPATNPDPSTGQTPKNGGGKPPRTPEQPSSNRGRLRIPTGTETYLWEFRNLEGWSLDSKGVIRVTDPEKFRKSYEQHEQALEKAKRRYDAEIKTPYAARTGKVEELKAKKSLVEKLIEAGKKLKK